MRGCLRALPPSVSFPAGRQRLQSAPPDTPNPKKNQGSVRKALQTPNSFGTIRSLDEKHPGAGKGLVHSHTHPQFQQASSIQGVPHMHAVQPAPVPEALADKFQRLQADALETIHWVMLHLAEGLRKPIEEDPTQARTTTQRIRLCIQAARDILYAGDPTSTDPQNKPRVSTTRLWRKPELTRTPNAKTAQAGARASSSTNASSHDETPTTLQPTTARPANHILAAAGTGVSRFGERITPLSTPEVSSAPTRNTPPAVDHASPLRSHASSLTAPSVTPVSPRDSSLVAHTSPPLAPNYFTREEFRAIIAIMQTREDRLTPHLYARIHEWNGYAKAAGLPIALGIKEHEVEARKPLEPTHAPTAPPTSSCAPQSRAATLG